MISLTRPLITRIIFFKCNQKYDSNLASFYLARKNSDINSILQCELGRILGVNGYPTFPLPIRKN